MGVYVRVGAVCEFACLSACACARLCDNGTGGGLGRHPGVREDEGSLGEGLGVVKERFLPGHRAGSTSLTQGYLPSG